MWLLVESSRDTDTNIGGCYAVNLAEIACHEDAAYPPLAVKYPPSDICAPRECC